MRSTVPADPIAIRRWRPLALAALFAPLAFACDETTESGTSADDAGAGLAASRTTSSHSADDPAGPNDPTNAPEGAAGDGARDPDAGSGEAGNGGESVGGPMGRGGASGGPISRGGSGGMQPVDHPDPDGSGGSDEPGNTGGAAGNEAEGGRSGADTSTAGNSAWGGEGGLDDRGGEGGLGGAPAPEPEPDAGEPEPFGVPGIIAVGYGGLRIVTRDLGDTWEDETHWSTDGGDDRELLRTIAYGNGIWVSGGWRFTTSVDGVEWVDQGDALDVIDAITCPVTDGMAFGAGRFLVACGSNLASSTNGLDWERVGPTPNVGGHPYLFFDEATEQFACSGDNGNSFVSDDGEEWTEIDIDTVHLCEDGLTPRSECPSFYHDGVFLSTEWGGLIRRSTNGSNWTNEYNDQFGNNLFTEYSFAVGRVAP